MTCFTSARKCKYPTCSCPPDADEVQAKLVADIQSSLNRGVGAGEKRYYTSGLQCPHGHTSRTLCAFCYGF